MDLRTLITKVYGTIINKLDGKEILYARSEDGRKTCILSVIELNPTKQMFSFESFDTDNDESLYSINIFIDDDGTVSYNISNIFDLDLLCNEIKTLIFVK